MRIIKLLFISFIIFFVVLTGITSLIPSNIRLSKVVSVKAPRDSIFSLIRNKDQWHRWHPSFNTGNSAATNLLHNIKTRVISETDSTLTMSWQLENKKPISSTWQLHKMEAENDFTLQWSMYFQSSWYPWEKLKALFYEGRYGKMMQQGLDNIKLEAES